MPAGIIAGGHSVSARQQSDLLYTGTAQKRRGKVYCISEWIIQVPDGLKGTGAQETAVSCEYSGATTTRAVRTGNSRFTAYLPVAHQSKAHHHDEHCDEHQHKHFAIPCVSSGTNL